MEMRPCILREPANSDDKSVNGTVERRRVVRDGDPHIMRTGTFDNIPLRACPLDSHPLRRVRIAVPVFDRLARSDIDFAAGFKRLHLLSFLLFDVCLRSSDIRPVV
jgi:hypothetical protein